MTLNISCQFVLACKVSLEKSADNKFYLFIFRERVREGEREGVKYWSVSLHILLGRNPVMCPDWESKQANFCFAGQCPAEPDWSGLALISCNSTIVTSSVNHATPRSISYTEKLLILLDICQNNYPIHLEVFFTGEVRNDIGGNGHLPGQPGSTNSTLAWQIHSWFLFPLNTTLISVSASLCLCWTIPAPLCFI